LILITNDDGVKSPGLFAAVRALRGLGELMVTAPLEQQSSSGRAFYWKARRAKKGKLRIGRTTVTTLAVDASPAVSVRYALMLGVPRPPALVVSGINYGENLGSGLTISGTVGAALEAAAEGFPALAVSLETDAKYHTSYSPEIDFSAAADWTRRMAEYMLFNQLPDGAPMLNVNIPRNATRETRWRVTCASNQAYFRSLVSQGRFVGYDVVVDRESLERESDIYALLVDRVVSVTPLSYDLTARISLAALSKQLEHGANGRRKGNSRAGTALR
jgi:5'-nucleotidase